MLIQSTLVIAKNFQLQKPMTCSRMMLCSNRKDELPDWLSRIGAKDVQWEWKWAIPENREFQKWKLSFFRQRHTLSMSFYIFVITYRVTNFLPKLVNMLLFSTEITEFPFLVFPYFRVMPWKCLVTATARVHLLRSVFGVNRTNWAKTRCPVHTGRTADLHASLQVWCCLLCGHSNRPQWVPLFVCACCEVLRILCERRPGRYLDKVIELVPGFLCGRVLRKPRVLPVQIQAVELPLAQVVDRVLDEDPPRLRRRHNVVECVASCVRVKDTSLRRKSGTEIWVMGRNPRVPFHKRIQGSWGPGPPCPQDF